MSDINVRFRQVREELKKTQAEFADIIGLSRSGVAAIESGQRAVTEKHIKLLCVNPVSGKYVNAEWLRTGNGDMLLEFAEDEFIKAAATLSNDAFVRSLIVEYWKLDEDSKKLFRDFIHRLSDNMRGQE